MGDGRDKELFEGDGGVYDVVTEHGTGPVHETILDRPRMDISLGVSFL